MSWSDARSFLWEDDVSDEKVKEIVDSLKNVSRTDYDLAHPFFHEAVTQFQYIGAKKFLRAFPVKVKADLSILDKYGDNVVVRIIKRESEICNEILEALAFDPETNEVDFKLVSEWKKRTVKKDGAWEYFNPMEDIIQRIEGFGDSCMLTDFIGMVLKGDTEWRKVFERGEDIRIMKGNLPANEKFFEIFLGHGFMYVPETFFRENEWMAKKEAILQYREERRREYSQRY
jgi:hypothetical protein